jgi:hypothetical protein
VVLWYSWGSESCFKGLVSEPEDKRPLVSPRRKWEDDIKMDHREIDIDGKNLIRLAQDRI